MENNIKINSLVLLVGGLGTRLKSIVKDVPKPMAPVKNKPFLFYVIQYWYDKGVRNFHLLIGFKGSIIKKYFGSSFRDGKIFYYSEKKLAGTGGALKMFLMKAKNFNQDENFLLMNGDTWLCVDVIKLMQDSEKNKNKITIAVYEMFLNSRYGTLNIKNNHILNILPFNEKKAFINGGLYVLNANILLEYLQKQIKYKFSFETDILPNLMKDKKVIASFSINKFLDIGIPEDYIKTIDIVR